MEKRKMTDLLTQKKFGRMLIVAVALTLALALMITPAAQAGEYIEGEPDATLEAGEVVEDDLFIAGEDVLVAGIVEGDLFAGGMTVTITGEVRGNVFAGGQLVVVSGKIDGALMTGGYSVVLEEGAEIGKNVYVGAFSFAAEPETVIGRSIYGGAYQVILDGEVGRDVTTGSAALQISGAVGGDVLAEVGEDNGQPDFMYQYWSPGVPQVEMIDPGYEIEEGAVTGSVDVTVTPMETHTDVEFPDVKVDPAYLAFRSLRQRTGEFIGLLLVGALLLWLMKDLLMKVVDEIRSNAGADTLWGLLVFFLYIPVILTLFVVLGMVVVLFSILTLGSLTGELIAVSSLGFIGLTTVFSLLAGLVTKIAVAYLFGRWLLGKLTQLSFEGYWHHIAALASGLFLYELLRAIPLFGWLVQAVVVVIGIGAIFVLVKNYFRKETPAQPETQVLG
jgi:hypothetical protein